MSNSVLIRGGTVVNADREFLGDVLCRDGLIVAVGDNAAELAPADAEVIDAGGQDHHHHRFRHTQPAAVVDGSLPQLARLGGESRL